MSPWAPVASNPPSPPKWAHHSQEGFSWTMQCCLVCSASPWLSKTLNLSHLGTADHIPHWFWVSKFWCLVLVVAPQHDPASCTCSSQLDPHWAAAPRLILAQQGSDGAWSIPALGCLLPGNIPELQQTATSPGPTSPGWEETEPCQNLMIFHARGEKTLKNPTKFLLLFSSFYNTSDLGFLIKSVTLPPALSSLWETAACKPAHSRNLLFWSSFSSEKL